MSLASEDIVVDNSTETTRPPTTTITDNKLTTTELPTNDSKISNEEELEKVNPRIQRQTMACASSPCGSNGLCYDVPFPAPLPAGYYCVCNEGFTGSQCEKGMYYVFFSYNPPHSNTLKILNKYYRN